MSSEYLKQTKTILNEYTSYWNLNPGQKSQVCKLVYFDRLFLL